MTVEVVVRIHHYFQRSSSGNLMPLEFTRRELERARITTSKTLGDQIHNMLASSFSKHVTAVLLSHLTEAVPSGVSQLVSNSARRFGSVSQCISQSSRW